MTVHPLTKKPLSLNDKNRVYCITVDLETGDAVVLELNPEAKVPERYQVYYKCSAVHWMKFTSLLSTEGLLPSAEYTLYVQLHDTDETTQLYNNVDLGFGRKLSFRFSEIIVSIARVIIYPTIQSTGLKWDIILGVGNSMPKSAFSEVLHEGMVNYVR